ncbi:MAG: Crp/Fnr family transcriptional regulator [Bacteroidota bacterium]|nr:Crp/Fnr family transcriptional regulator [Bacteroidota bacterium]
METTKCTDCHIFKSAQSNIIDCDFEKLKEASTNVKYKKNEIIFKENALSTNVIFLRKGIIKTHRMGPRWEQILSIIKAPTYIGLPTTFGDKVNHYSATSLIETDVCFINIDIFKTLITQNGAFSYELIIDLAQKELVHFERCMNRTQKNLTGRMGDFLISLSENIFENNTFEIPLTRAEIGNYVDTSRESVSRTLSDFNNDKIIDINGRKIKILDKKRLHAISKNG